MSSPTSPDELAAHALLSELRTRIATQGLPYQYGVEAGALKSLHDVFTAARDAMKDHPGCEAFARSATRMLNVELRPFTAKWHRAQSSGLLSSMDGANEFRADLARLRVKLAAYCLELQSMAYGRQVPDDDTPPALSADELAAMFEPIGYGLGVEGDTDDLVALSHEESAEVEARRATVGVVTPAGVDAVGLALSGGGIRSATFCLGVLQVLARRGLARDVDYLSTVSGGGYLGAFVTSCVGAGSGFDALGDPHGPDTAAVRRLRRNAKYLSATNWRQRWMMVTGTVAGLLLNWTAPACVLAFLALVGSAVGQGSAVDVLLAASKAFGLATVVGVLIYGIALRYGVGAELGRALLAGAAGLTAAALTLAAVEQGYHLFRGAWNVHGAVPAVFAIIIATPAMVRFLPLFHPLGSRRLALGMSLTLAGAVVPASGVVAYYALRIVGSESLDGSSFGGVPLGPVGGLGLLTVLAASTGAYALFGLNINLTGPHKLYRDQLSRTFVQLSSGAAVPTLDGVNPSRLAPYHLINATLNLPSSKSDLLKDRRADFFMFSKCRCGSPALGYMPTAKWRANNAPIDLATAMAVSGAAASPHMGLGSVPTLSALLTLLNIRLGFWISHPGRWVFGAPGFVCLLREMTGLCMSERNAWLNLSDGGHIENMGVYELLRRRCKFIVCVDGEADPGSTFSGQLTLVRHAQIDLGIRIEPRFDDVRTDPDTRYSRSHLQLFRVFYPSGLGRPEGLGLMLYLKLSMTGNEAELLKRYRTLHPEFPHQSTLDQFYDEEQFEAYRQLGVHVAEGAFSPALMTDYPDPGTVSLWFRQLAAHLLEPTTGKDDLPHA